MIMKTVNKTLALIALASSSAAFAATDFDTLDVDGNGWLAKVKQPLTQKLCRSLKH
jgi:hypothetical protein